MIEAEDKSREPSFSAFAEAGDWFVKAAIGTQTRQIGPFQSEEAAALWIRNDSTPWVQGLDDATTG